MAMALKADVSQSCSMSLANKPVDLVHLAKQTMGDRELEDEVLGIFLSQCDLYIGEFKQAGDTESRRRAAHRIKGSAKGLGAWELAEIAEEAEQPGFTKLESLEAAARRVSDYIHEIR